MIFDLTASTSEPKKIMALDPNYPQDVTVNIIKGNTTSATFGVEISVHGKPAEYTYQWYVDDQPVEGGNEPSYTISNIADEITHRIFCEVTNKKGTVASRIATLTVTQSFPPTLDDSFPKDATLTIGESIACEAVILEEGKPAVYTYQWYKDGTAVDGANSASYTFTPSEAGTTTLYCEVSNSAGTVTSRTATITATNRYLFKDGDQVSDLTGGWGSSGWSSGVSGFSLKAPTVNSSGITLSCEMSKYPTAGTANKIDLSKVNSICVKIAENTASMGGYIAVNSTKKVNPSGMTASAKISGTGEIVLNVSSITEGYVVLFAYGSGGTKIRATEIRME